MWERAVLYASMAAALFSVGPLGPGQNAPAEAMTARSAAHTAVTQGPHGEDITRSSDGLFYIDAQLGSGKAKMLVDTGASHVILSHADAKKAISHPDSSGGTRIVTAGGAIDADWVVIDRLELHGNVLKNVRAAIPHRDTGLSLLGQSALVQFSSVRIDGDKLSLAQ